MNPFTLIFTIAAVTAATAAYADDEMLGTMINGRMETRGERDVRVADPKMDREEAIIDRERRQNRETALPDGQGKDVPAQPYRGKLPD